MRTFWQTQMNIYSYTSCLFFLCSQKKVVLSLLFQPYRYFWSKYVFTFLFLLNCLTLLRQVSILLHTVGSLNLWRCMVALQFYNLLELKLQRIPPRRLLPLFTSTSAPVFFFFFPATHLIKTSRGVEKENTKMSQEIIIQYLAKQESTFPSIIIFSSEGKICLYRFWASFENGAKYSLWDKMTSSWWPWILYRAYVFELVKNRFIFSMSLYLNTCVCSNLYRQIFFHKF